MDNRKIALLQYARINLVEDMIYDSFKIVVEKLYEHHKNILMKMNVEVDNDEDGEIITLCRYNYFHNGGALFIIVEEAHIMIDKCSAHPEQHFSAVVSHGQVDEEFIKNFQYVIYNANTHNEI
jgi:S-adenosylmethionine/arginine decarboxylase-like enzyme